MNRIGDHALIGDCHSAALVGRDGTIEWACFPRFDSPAVFAKLLDEERGGWFTIAPAEAPRATHRRYIPDTNVLVTTFEVGDGVLEVTDLMPVERAPEGPTRVRTDHAILRRARCTAGTVDVVAELTPRFEYASFVPRFRALSAIAADVVGGADALAVRSTRPLDVSSDAVRGRWRLAAGDEAWVWICWRRSFDQQPPAPDAATLADDYERALAATIAFWRDWIADCWYDGIHEPLVRRSALILKAMTYAPSGAVVAAPTTSLPELIGGGRNWDYRYTWIRDATLTLTALFVLGLTDEADAFKHWLERAAAGRADTLQIMFGVGGERALHEIELDHLAGHRGSRPVRIGNGAYAQMQLDAYGQILESAYLYGLAGGELTSDNWRFLSSIADAVCERWRLPDQGIWEVRDEPRHFTHSKLHCWLALDRALKIAGGRRLEAPVARWKAERDAIREYILELAAPDGWFHQAVGFPVPDASTLLVPAVGFIPSTHPLAKETIDTVRRALERDGLVYRYLSPDGIEGGEGTFLLCSFWLLDALTHSGRLDEAQALLERLVGFANDVGLFAEEIDPSSGDPLGNFPQAFSHMALVQSCAHLSAALRGEIQDGAYDYAELAVQRLLARTRAG